MRKLIVFNHVSLDGYFTDANGDTSFAQNDNPVDPVVLGEGRTMFEGIKEKLPLKLKQSRTFGNGNVLLFYEYRNRA